MSAVAPIEGNRALSPQDQFRSQLERMGEQFAHALPSHIKPERFQRVVMTAVLSDPNILNADRKSLMESAIRAAQDGLLPDKREGAFVVFNAKDKVDGRDVWIKKVQWMPMVGGIIKRIQQSGEIKMLTARVVYEGDHFRTWIDDTGEHVEYEPGEDQNQDTVRRVFAMATTRDGAVYVEPLSARDVEKIRSVSRSKDSGPWKDWWEEMAKKSAIRRLAKRLPLSTEVHDLMQRDNELYDLSQTPDPRPSLRDRLAAGREERLTDAREGFGTAMVDLSPNAPPAPAAGTPDAIGTAAEDDATAPGEPEHDRHDEVVRSEAEKRQAEAATSKPPRDPILRANLIECSQKLLETANGTAEPDELERALDAATNAWKKELPANGDEVKRIYQRAHAVVTGSLNVPAAVKLIAAELDLPEAEIKPRAR